MGDAVALAIRGPCNGNPAKTVTDQDHFAQILPREHVADITHERIERDVRAKQMRALAQSGLGRRIDAMACCLQDVPDPLPAPATVPGTMDKDIRFRAFVG